MTGNDPKQQATSPAKAQRDARLAKALRDNLRRRKAAPPTPPPTTPSADADAPKAD